MNWTTGFLIFAASAASCATFAQTRAQVREVDTALATLRISQQTCDLVVLDWKNPALPIIREPRLGENFRILVPQEQYQANYFNSRDQAVSRIEAAPDGVLCSYDSLKNSRETLPIKVRYHIRAVGEQIQFSIEVENPTHRKLAEVMYGIVGGQQGVGDRLSTESLIPGANVNLAPGIFSRFNGGGNLGIRYYAVTFAYPGRMAMGWTDFYNPKSGLGYYYANQDPETRLTLLDFEMRPFTKSASMVDSWPTPTEANGEPIGVTMGWVDFPYLSNGTFQAGPVALQVHRGDWHAASHIYRSWFDQHFTVVRPADWLRKQNAWQSIILANGEDVIVHRFDELPKLGADAKKYGITTFEILGWDMGGIDRGYPQYEPSPRLGSLEDFRKALADMRAIGVHPLIFSNIQEADTATPLYKNTLKSFTVEGRWAPDLHLNGWGEGTISARACLTCSRMTLVSPAHPEFREFLIKQYLDLARDGAEGFQFDKTNILDELDFNPTLPVSPDKSLSQGVLDVMKELLERGRAIDPQLSLASEIWFDRAFPYVDVSYMRMGRIDMDSTALRYTFPEWTATIFGESPGDFGPMNNGMRYGLVWALAPRHYNDSADEALTRPLAQYVAELIRIRKEFEPLLFFGRFNDTMGATVKADSDIRYSVFIPLTNEASNRACVLVNFGDAAKSAQVSFDGESGSVTIAGPFQADRNADLPLDITIPPHQLVVVVKE